MKRTLNQTQLENMIAECVGQVLAESRQPQRVAQKPNRKVMNEAQMQAYIRNIINEEIENEGLWGGIKGALGKIGGDIGRAAQGAGRAMQGAVQGAGRAMQGAVQGAGKAMQGAAQYGRNVMQAGRNASAAADIKKLSNQLNQAYTQYQKSLTPEQLQGLGQAVRLLQELSQSFANGNAQA